MSQNSGDMGALVARQLAQRTNLSLRSEGVMLDAATRADLEATIRTNYTRLGNDGMSYLATDVIDHSIDQLTQELFRLRLELNQDQVDGAMVVNALTKLCPNWPFCG